MEKLSAMRKIEELRAIYLAEETSEERIKLGGEIYDLIVKYFESVKLYYRFRDKNR